MAVTGSQSLPHGVGTVATVVLSPGEARRGVAGGAWVATLTALFAATLCVSAGLLFVVQPMFAKMVLPHLGGSPAVWNTCVVFFQAAMLAGYAYAHLTSRWLPLPRQAVVHVGLLLMAGLVLPVAIPDGWAAPVASTPIPALLLLLATTLGLPFFIVSATAPLLQRWFSHTAHPSAEDPYFLYAASNVGSMVALLGYPFILEPSWRLSQQSAGWAVAYAVFVTLIAGCAALAVRGRRGEHVTVSAPFVAAPVAQGVTWARRARWVALACVPSSLMLGVTTFLTSDVAAVPLLWTLPLVLYLLTFVLAFATRPIVSPRVASRVMAALVLPLMGTILLGVGEPLWILMVLHLMTFFACGLVLHGRLADDRPATSHLTEFYLWISVGGLLGGLFNTLIAPVLFTSVLEYPLALALACGLRPWAMRRATARVTGADIALPVVAAATLLFALVLVQRGIGGVLLFGTAVGLGSALYLACTKRPLRIAAAMALLAIGGSVFVHGRGELLHAERTFFGVLRVKADSVAGVHRLLHGRTVHGEQRTDPARRHEPMSYYHPAGPVGQVLQVVSANVDRVGVVGLGTGVLAAYARPGQHWTFYEIDPAVERVARTPAFFTYLADCGEQCDVVLGDARLSLVAAPEGAYDLMVLDAFSSDAIPAHLVTKEALALYMSRVTDAGLIAFHISNRHLDLRPVLGALTRELGLAARVQRHTPAEGDDGAHASEWVVIARAEAALAPIAEDPRWESLPGSSARVWTDDYSDILSVLKTF